MTDKELEELLTLFQTNLAVVQASEALIHFATGEGLVNKAIKNLDGILTKLEVKQGFYINTVDTRLKKLEHIINGLVTALEDIAGGVVDV